MARMTKHPEGYHWVYKGGSLFLPNGTEIRMPYYDDFFYARVVAGQILYNGVVVTPAGFTTAITNSSRNAWRCLWIKMSRDGTWTLANDYRPKATRAVILPTFGGHTK